jgi:glycosyltransferase involved in cell wall biosynthesis
VYTRKQPARDTGPHPAQGEIEIVHLGQKKSFLMEPLNGNAPDSLPFDYLLLLAEVRERVEARPGAQHILISFFASNSGFVAQHVALALGIPHIASIQGSDFSRDFHSPLFSHAIQFVVEHAQMVVTNNQEQARVLAATFPAARAIRTVHNAMPQDVFSEPWAAPASRTIRLATDCQFSYKKATHLLLGAVSELLQEGTDVALTVAGEAVTGEEDYWEKCKREHMARFPDAFCFPGWMSDKEVNALLLASHVYVSASLGEGCSLSQIRALTLGIPMVLTRCGATPEFVEGAAHVRLCALGSLGAFADELRSMVADFRTGNVRVDQDRVRQWRKYFSPGREGDEWKEVVASI